ncbi:MAG: ElyC/SanA/YdcF family protein [Bacteroidota bacterium]
MKLIFKKLAIALGAAVFLLLLVLGVCNLWVVESTSSQIYSNINNLPYNDVGLVLGTSNFTRAGTTNLHFKNRMDAAARLYKSGKVKHLLLSGANHVAYYNEPHKMRRALVERGIPEKAMTLDYAGLRTFDSMIRARKIFGLSSVTVVSQEFHNYRALFIGNRNGLHAIAYNAQEAPLEQTLETEVREYFARVNAVLDMYVMNTQPRFLGKWEPVIIDTNEIKTDSIPPMQDTIPTIDSLKKTEVLTKPDSFSKGF